MVLVLGVALAYFTAHLVVERLQRRFMFATGVEYLLLGILIGPYVANLGIVSNLTPLAPVVALAAGWVGLTNGMALNLQQLQSTTDRAARLAIFEGVFTALPVAAAGAWLFTTGWLGDVESNATYAAAGALGATAWAGSLSALDLVITRYGVSGDVHQLLRRTSMVGDVLAVGAFGLLFCAFHVENTLPNVVEPPSGVEWAVLTVGIGLVLGLLFSFFLDDDDSENGRFLALVGIITFAAGAAFFLNLSVLLVCMLLGMVLAHTPKHAAAVRHTLQTTRKPVTLILFVFAGALWRPPDDILLTVGTVAAYILLRAVGKMVGCALASMSTTLRPDLARGLMAQGDVAVAMAISLRLVYEGPAVDVAYTVILSSVILHEIIAPFIVKRLLIDTGDIRAEAMAA
jgi:Kef-type K+ transport system membrane component KefB